MGFTVMSWNGASFDDYGFFSTPGQTSINNIEFIDASGNGTLDIVVTTAGEGIVYFSNDTDLIETTTTTTTTIVPGNGRDFFPQIDLESQSGARNSLDNVRLVQESLAQAIGQLGAEQSRLLLAYEVIKTENQNVLDAGARIDDADIAVVSSQYANNRIRIQAAASILSQANQNGRQVLDLL